MRDKDRIEYEELEDYIDSLQHRIMKKDEKIEKLEEIIKLLQKENALLKSKIGENKRRYYAERDIDEEFE
jgi:predicted  nucleic acid-binding Zn-ribbon protein